MDFMHYCITKEVWFERINGEKEDKNGDVSILCSKVGKWKIKC